jgi:hemoglobin-like flavoprotein
MTPEQIYVVKLSFNQVLNQRKLAGELFYDRLFAIAPDVRAMFKGDMEHQGQKMIDMLALTVGNLKDPASLQTMLGDLGRRHVKYGVKDEHYPPVGQALSEMLGEVLGDAFTPQVRDAWTSLYAAVVAAMKSGGAPEKKIA